MSDTTTPPDAPAGPVPETQGRIDPPSDTTLADSASEIPSKPSVRPFSPAKSTFLGYLEKMLHDVPTEIEHDAGEMAAWLKSVI